MSHRIELVLGKDVGWFTNAGANCWLNATLAAVYGCVIKTKLLSKYDYAWENSTDDHSTYAYAPSTGFAFLLNRLSHYHLNGVIQDRDGRVQDQKLFQEDLSRLYLNGIGNIIIC